MQLAHPHIPNLPNFSSSRKLASIAPMITLIAPRGVTRIAGAKVYAAKLATEISFRVLLIDHDRLTFADNH